jgi:nicotinate-nucleotide adenylyltransferase
MTIGLLGGAFDPPHNGHLVLAREAIRHFDLRRLVVIVTGTPPHKEVGTPAELRFRLAEAAFAGIEGVELSRVELEREGPSYTLDTARWARAVLGEDVVFLIGADEFASFLSWHEPEGVLASVRLGVATRPGYPRSRLDAVLAQLSRPDRVELFEIPALPVSSTEIRDRAGRGEPIDDLGLYRVGRGGGPI